MLERMLNRYFALKEHGTSVKKEFLAGAVTFFTMAYIIFLQPAVLSGGLFHQSTGLSAESVALATILSAFLATMMMGLFAKLPIALAPGMGENFFFTLTVVPVAASAGSANPAATALGAVFLSGILFLVITLVGGRRWILKAVSPGMKSSVAAGIGLFIAFIGLKNGMLIINAPSSGIALNPHLAGADGLVFGLGLAITVGLHAFKVPGSILWGILATTLIAIVMKLIYVPMDPGSTSLLFSRLAIPDHLFSLPGSDLSTFFALDIAGASKPLLWPMILVLLFMIIFDTTGTLIAVGERAQLTDQKGELPRMERAFLTDASATVVGALFGTSTVTAYIESTAGVEQGGRTGLMAIFTALFFLSALFLHPVIQLIGSYSVITAPALLMVGAMMIQSIRQVDWRDVTEAVPALLTLIGIPLTFSIADGIALGLLSYPLIKLVAGRKREINFMMVLLAIIVLGYFIFLRPKMG